MRSSRLCGRTLSAPLMAFGLALTVAPVASADPTDASTESPAPVADQAPANVAAPAPVDPGSAIPDACKVFGAAMNYAATNYEDFAYATAGNGNFVNYQDPSVSDSNVIGRTALKEAAGAAWDASTTPGLPPDVSTPMQAWSLHATKLVLIMGLRGGGDSLNSAANDLNTDAHNAQMACALNGSHA